jgi:hypothetical protein
LNSDDEGSPPPIRAGQRGHLTLPISLPFHLLSLSHGSLGRGLPRKAILSMIRISHGSRNRFFRQH